MHEDRSSGCPNDDGAGNGKRSKSPLEEDIAAERGVLHCVLEVYPELYTKNDLVRQLATDPDVFGQRDAVLRAIRDLAKVGLLNVSGPLVVPSRAAIKFDLLSER